MKHLMSRKILVGAIVLTVGLAIYVASLPVSKAVVISGPYACAYYKDAHFKKVVGVRGVGCCGETISWGTTSSYVRCERLYCLDVLCPN